MGAGRGRGGIRSWRLRLRRTSLHHSPSDGSGDQGEPAGGGSGGGDPSPRTGGTGGTTGQASLDQVLRQAAAARVERPDEGGRSPRGLGGGETGGEPAGCL